MKIAPIADVKAKFSAYVEGSKQGPVVVTKNGKAVAAIVPLADDDEVERLVLGYSPRFRAILSESPRRIQREGTIPQDQFWKAVRSRPRKRAKRNGSH